MLRAAPSILCSSRHVLRPIAAHRHFGANSKQIPSFLEPFFQYASDTYITQGIQAGIELVHSMDIPWVASFVVTGVALRVLTSPMHIMAEKLCAKHIHIKNHLTIRMFEQISKRNGIPVISDPVTHEPKFAHPNEEINLKANNLVKNAIKKYFDENRLQMTRIMIMKTSTLPIWLFSAFSIRNVLTADFGVNLSGFLWVGNFLEPDPYFILPVATILVGFLNFYSQRMILPTEKKYKFKVYDGIMGLSLLIGTTIMVQMPACLSVYWLSAGVTGIAQSLVLRHPRVKNWLGISRLPTDSKTPFRDLFFLRRRQLM